jgi:FkbM family methyltransferase
MFESLRRIRKRMRALVATRDASWARRAVRLGIDPAQLSRADRDGRVLHQALGVRLRADEGECLLARIEAAAELVARGTRFELGERGDVLATTPMFRTYVRTAEEVQILDEVARAGAYNFTVGGELLILDVGMNVGMASLFFAAKHPDALVHGFEPFAKTRLRAQDNLDLNPGLAARIEMEPYGLSDGDREMPVEYSECWRGSVGVNGLPRQLHSTDRELQVMQLRDSAAVVERLVAEHPRRRIVMKIDCEGSEYEIVRRLAARDQLRNVHAIAMECHRRRPTDVPAQLNGTLAAAGFSFVHLDPDSRDISMVYAFRCGG